VVRGSLPDLRDVQRSARSFDMMALYATNRYNLTAGGETEQILGGQITEDLLPLLGVQPAIGRNFSAGDTRADVVRVAYSLWQSDFGGDPAVLGRSVNLSGTSYTVIGVAPEWFRFPSAEFQLWTSLATIEAKSPEMAQNRALRIFTGIARLAPGVTLA